MHEYGGGWFFRDKSGGPAFVQLWKTMLDYFTKDRALNNLIWGLGIDGSPSSAYYPGTGYYDIIGSDTYDYLTTSDIVMLNACKSVAGSSMPIDFHECGTPPDPTACQRAGAMGSWLMIWDRDILQAVSTSHLQYVYSHNLVITLDKMNPGQPPDVTPGPTTPPACNPVAIVLYIQVNGGTWQNVSSVSVSLGANVIIGPQPATYGTWNWSGCNTSGTAREQTIYPTISCTPTATYTNDCGATSTQTFTITVDVTVTNGDVNASDSIDIVDALLVAQYYVGLITSFPC